MTRSAIDSNNKSRGSKNWRPVGVISMALIVIAYLAATTVSLVGELDSPKRIVILTVLWLLGLTALALLVRAWRHFSRASSVPDR